MKVGTGTGVVIVGGWRDGFELFVRLNEDWVGVAAEGFG